MTPAVLLVEDDALLADALSAQLERAGYRVRACGDGAQALELLLADGRGGGALSLVVLDQGLPGLGGLDVLRQARAQGVTLPILILTARDGLDDRVAGLNAGADDYLCKPFDFPELHARLQALLRRQAPRLERLQLADLLIDVPGRRATLAGIMLDLSPREWTLLLLLMRHAQQVVRKDSIHEAWEGDERPDDRSDEREDTAAASGVQTNVIEVYIHRLRRKLEGSRLSIRTVRGLGYLLDQAGA
ncbi:response regulator transcription factor [Amphibiibacter pelophylacis]|uniref:Response regulator transcription factor n=1 Tax=Amphibiibacter pelophylacis TaxID=1799477 RepID=A0ACC6P0A1_9BURK